MVESPPETPSSSEYEREPVPRSAWKASWAFVGMYAGEHTAGTEFLIGPMFLLGSVGFGELVVALLLGNALAVFAWRWMVAEVATRDHLTFYFQLERIAGPGFTKWFALVNGLLFCATGGSMITVSATAVGVPLGIDMPGMSDVYATNLPFIILVITLGTVMTVVASRGYDAVSRFSDLAAPPLVLGFCLCGISSLLQLKVYSYSGFLEEWATATTFIQQKETGAEPMSFLKVLLFGFCCNAAAHLGMSDLSIFRYAQQPSAGWASAAGMFLGHYVAWISAAIMLVNQIKQREDCIPVPGVMAYESIGSLGVVAVLVAGWTTANPNIYRAGLAFDSMWPGRYSTQFLTLVAGGTATFAGLFPILAYRVLTFTGLFGTTVAPIGGIIFADCFLAHRIDVQRFPAEARQCAVNHNVLYAWLLCAVPAIYLIVVCGWFAAYFPLPCWLLTMLLYLSLEYMQLDAMLGTRGGSKQDMDHESGLELEREPLNQEVAVSSAAKSP